MSTKMNLRLVAITFVISLLHLANSSLSFADAETDAIWDRVTTDLSQGKCPDLSQENKDSVEKALKGAYWKEKDLQKNETLRMLGEQIASKSQSVFTLAKAEWNEFASLPRHDLTNAHALKLVGATGDLLFIMKPYMPPSTFLCIW